MFPKLFGINLGTEVDVTQLELESDPSVFNQEIIVQMEVFDSIITSISDKYSEFTPIIVFDTINDSPLKKPVNNPRHEGVITLYMFITNCFPHMTFITVFLLFLIVPCFVFKKKVKPKIIKVVPMSLTVEPLKVEPLKVEYLKTEV
jgi:hypothetical protein